MSIIDTNGQPAEPNENADIVGPGGETSEDPFLAQMEQDLLGKVVQMPVNAHKLDRRCKIKQFGERRAVELLFETVLDGPRVNLLMLRIFFAAENAEREVMKLPDAMVANLVEQFEKRAASAEAEPESPDAKDGD